MLNFYLVAGVAGRWQFWADAVLEDACWLAPVENSEGTLAALQQQHPQLEVRHPFALVPKALLSPENASEQPGLF